MTASQIQQALADNIKAARKKLDLSQMKLAELADISVGHMNDIERSRRWISAETLSRLAFALKLKPFQLLAPDQTSEIFDKYNALTALSKDLKEEALSSIDQIIAKHLNK